MTTIGGMPDLPFEDPSAVPVTRIEVLDFVGEAFGGGPVDRDTLVRTAAAGGARGALLTRLRNLPDERYAEPDDMWSHLPDVPEDLRRS